ncbi:MAG: hypothetical protein KAY65_05825 [Planctomycetes bacterium]|nr:hypothetical protein [Planctomycetota bacterium]
MPGQKQDNDNPKTAKRKKKHVWLAAIVVVTTAIILCLLWRPWNSESIDERLAEIEAARAIPDSENAAVIYRQLAKSGGLTGARPGYSDARDTFEFTRPWRGKDYPKVAAWLEDRQDVIGELLKASKFEKCRFKDFVEPGKVMMTTGAAQLYRIARYGMRDIWRDLLICALSNDIAEGRKAAAIEKHLCLMQMANHQRQDTDLIEFAQGVATEMMALLATASFIVEGDVTRKDLETVEAALPQTKDNWARDSATMVEVYRLNLKKFGYPDRLRYLWRDLFSDKGWLDRVKNAYLTGLAARRGTHILIALRRHKNRSGHWPETLDEIRSSVTKEILTDPQNNGPFVYRPTKEGFTLYSKGKNKIDETGRFSFVSGGADDWPIWPPPARETKASDNADPNESSARPESTE